MTSLIRNSLALLCLFSTTANATAFARTVSGDVEITLHKAPCTLKAEVTNLPNRVVWVEKGKATEGCWGVSPQFGIVMMYFADKTVAGASIQVFERITET